MCWSFLEEHVLCEGHGESLFVLLLWVKFWQWRILGREHETIDHFLLHCTLITWKNNHTFKGELDWDLLKKFIFQMGRIGDWKNALGSLPCQSLFVFFSLLLNFRV